MPVASDIRVREMFEPDRLPVKHLRDATQPVGGNQITYLTVRQVVAEDVTYAQHHARTLTGLHNVNAA